MLMPSIFGENLFDDFFGDFPFYYDKGMKDVEKKLYGRTYMGTLRTTFVIGPDGSIRRVFQPKEIKTKTHAEQVMAALQAAEQD